MSARQSSKNPMPHRRHNDLRAAAGEFKAAALALGFDLVGIAPASPARHGDYLRQWLASGQAGEMHWLHRNLDKLLDVSLVLPGAASILCVAANYHFPLVQFADDRPRGRLARYALGEDYHEVFKKRLHQLADLIRSQFPHAQTHCGVDTAPVLEREHAAAAGIGWIGKNTCVIHPKVGSWLLLGQVITTLELPPDEPLHDHCGACRRCIDACPTGAITEPYHLDARRCISYLTLEHRTPLDEHQQRMIGPWLAGCDICQEVCPFNRKAPLGRMTQLQPHFAEAAIPLDEVLAMDAQAYRDRFRKSALKRVKLPVMQANARTVLANLPPSSKPAASAPDGQRDNA